MVTLEHVSKKQAVEAFFRQRKRGEVEERSPNMSGVSITCKELG